MKLKACISRSFILAATAGLLAFGACQGENVTPGKASSPKEAFKMLFAAVKSKNPEEIKRMLSKNTMKFAEGTAGQMKKTLDEQIKNGFTRTTFPDKLPPIRDERVKGNMGAVEVFNAKDQKWENLPFILEDGGWKLAIGDVWFKQWQSPGDSRTVREQKIANTMNSNNTVPYGNGNVDFNANTVNQTPIVPRPAANNEQK